MPGARHAQPAGVHGAGVHRIVGRERDWAGWGGTNAAQAYVFNATVVPSGDLTYLTLWPQGAAQPTVSTLNVLDGAITSHMAIVPTNNTEISAYASGPSTTQLILDMSGYFRPNLLRSAIC